MNESTDGKPGTAAGERLPAVLQDSGREAPPDPHLNRPVLSDDGITVGRVERVTATHLSVRTPEESDAPGDQLWIPRDQVRTVDNEAVYLRVNRAEIHEAVLALPPGQQREYETLAFQGRLGRNRGMLADQGRGAQPGGSAT